MGQIAFVFPGQGSQRPGMGRSLVEVSPAAAKVFDMAEALRPGTKRQCFEGTDEELSATVNTQPCLYAVELAAARALMERGVEPHMLAGFSLGEVTALALSGAFTARQGMEIVTRRGELMQRAAEESNAAMAAVVKLENETVARLCREFERVYPVNFNAPGQVTVSGGVKELEAFKARVKELGGRCIPLKVGGGFHAPFMAPAAEEFEKALESYDIKAPAVPVYSNVTALPYEGDIKGLLARQMTSPVLWSRTVENMIAAGADTFIECGPGGVLSGLIARINESVRVLTVEDAETLDKTLSEVGAC